MSQSKSEQRQDILNGINNTTSLQTRLAVFVLFVALVPLIVISTRDILQTQQALKNSAEVSLKSSAAQTANSLDSFIQRTLDSVHAESQLIDFENYLTLPVNARIGTSVQSRTQNLLENLSKKDSVNIISYALVDTNGDILLDSATDVHVNESTQPYFLPVQFSDTPIVSYVTYEQDDTTSITFANAITNSSGGYIGVLRVKYKSAVLQDVIIKSIGPNTDTSVLLLDQLGIRLADSQNPELILKSITPLKPIDYSIAVNNHRLLDTSPEKQSTNYPDLESALDNAVNQPFFRTDITPNIPGDDTIAVAFLQTQPWTITYGRPTSNFLADVQQQTRTNIIFVTAASILITIIAVIFVRSLTLPIISLTKTANAISQGDLSARAEINTTDEIGLLARTFNKMSSQIQGLITDLEQRVEQRATELEQRTQELEQTIKQSEKRADELQTIAEIARSISTEKELENLLPLITQTVSERFSFYHVGIFLLNETGKFAVLRAANSPGGQIMLKRQHKLQVGQAGIVGNVTSTGIPRIVLNTGADTVFFNNPDLPETHSEMALPLTARGKIIGALDIQSAFANAFTKADVSILSLLADQIAITIDNTRLLEDTTKALSESQSVFRDYLAGAWQNKSTAEIFGYYQTLAGGQLITDNAAGQIDTINNKTNTIALPIQLRDQEIGTIQIRPNKSNRIWSKDEINIVQAIAERLGLALDNARLFEETSSRASRERLVSDITNKIRNTNDPQEMIKTAVQELQRALGASRVEIIPRKNAPPPDK